MEHEGFCRKTVKVDQQTAHFVPSDFTPVQVAESVVKRAAFGALFKGDFHNKFPGGVAAPVGPDNGSPGKLIWELVAIADPPAHLRPKSVKFWTTSSIKLATGTYARGSLRGGRSKAERTLRRNGRGSTHSPPP